MRQAYHFIVALHVLAKHRTFSSWKEASTIDASSEHSSLKWQKGTGGEAELTCRSWLQTHNQQTSLLFLPVLLGKEDTFFISSSPQLFPHKILGSRVSIFSGISSAFLSPCNTTPDTLFLVISFSPCKITPDPPFLVKIQPFKGGCLSTVSCTVLLLQGHLLSSDGK